MNAAYVTVVVVVLPKILGEHIFFSYVAVCISRCDIILFLIFQWLDERSKLVKCILHASKSIIQMKSLQCIEC